MVRQNKIKNYMIEETIINCLSCVLIFLLLHDIIAKVCIDLIQIFLNQNYISSNIISTFLQNNQTILAACVGNIIGIPFLIYWNQHYTKKEIPNDTIPNIKILLFIIIGISASIAFNGIFILSGLTTFFSNDYEQTTSQLYDGTLIVTIVFSAIIAPITEELLYRKLVYRQLCVEYGFPTACIASSILFGMAHMAIVQGIYGFLTGILLCYCYKVGKGVKTAILVHMVMNLTSICITQFLYNMLPEEQTLFFIVGSIVGICILTVFIVKSFTDLTKIKVE